MDRIDRNTLAAAQMGDLEAFGAVVEAYQDQLYTLALRLLCDSAEAQDAVQETLLRVYQHLPRYDDRFKFSTWVYRIATNACIDRLRRRRSESSLDGWSEDGEGSLAFLHERIASTVPTPEQALVQSETVSEVQRALGDLPPLYRTVIVLRYVQDLSLQEISDILHVPITTIKTRIHRGREALKQLLCRVPVS
jgi:RNA polymerase sigma-70 factor (ECF subfamily)